MSNETEPHQKDPQQDLSEQRPQPWSIRRPQRYLFTLGIVILMIAVMAAGFGFISGGEGGAVPFLMILVAPALGIFYIWYFNFSELAKGEKSA